LKIWEAHTGNVRKLSFKSALTSITADSNGKLIVVGSDSGCVHIVDCLYWKRAIVVDTERISMAGVAQISSVTHEDRCLSCAALLFDNKIAFFTVMFKDQKLNMHGFVDVAGNVEHICFHEKDFKSASMTPPKLLAVGAFRGLGSEALAAPCLWVMRAPPLEHEPMSVELRKDVCPMWSTRLSSNNGPEERPTVIASCTRKFVIIGFADGRISSYPVASSVGQPLAKQPPLQASGEYSSHSQLVTSLSVSADDNWIISGCMDGQIRKFPLQVGSRKAGLQKILHNPYNGGVGQVHESKDGACLISTGGSDGIIIWSGSNSEFRASRSEEMEEEEEDDENIHDYDATEVDDTDTSRYPLWAPVSAEEKRGDMDDPELHAVAVAQRKALVLEVEGLRKKLRVLIDQNALCPELEQLERHEFCIDFEERDAIALKSKEMCDELRAKIEKENVARQLIRDRLIKEFWNPMRAHGCQIRSLVSNFSVSNYPERIVSDEEQANIRKLKIMRKVELMEVQMLRSRDCPKELRGDIVLRSSKFATGSEAYVVNWWSTAGDDTDLQESESNSGDGVTAAGSTSQQAPAPIPSGGSAAGQTPVESSANAGSDTAAPSPTGKGPDSPTPAKGSATAAPGGSGTGVDIAEYQEQQYLYEPFELVTGSRRRLQVHLLQSLAAEYRSGFNEVFKKCQTEKKCHGSNQREDC